MTRVRQIPDLAAFDLRCADGLGDPGLRRARRLRSGRRASCLPLGDEAERDRMIASIGPFWDANETWLVLAVGLLLVAFPARTARS